MKWMMRSKLLLLLYTGICLPVHMSAQEETVMPHNNSTSRVVEVPHEQMPKKTGTQSLESVLPTPIHTIFTEPSGPKITPQPVTSVKPTIVEPTVPSSSVPSEPQVSLPTAPAEESGITVPVVPAEVTSSVQTPVHTEESAPQAPEKQPVVTGEEQVQQLAEKPEEETTIKTPAPLEQKEVVLPEKAQQSDEQQPKEVEKAAPKPSSPMLDTIDIEEGGNWLIKRQIFEDTFKLIDEMDQVNTKIRDMRMTFFQLRNDIDKEIALFVKDMGYNLGKLDQMATTMLKSMQQEKAQEGALNQEGRSVVISVQDLEKKIKVIQNAGQEILNLEDKIDSEILKSLEDRINESNGYRQQGWKNLQAIKRILSDEKAQNLYNKTKALYDTLTDVLSWLQSKLLPYFRQTIQTIKSDMNIVKSQIEELQQQGFDLQKEIDVLEKKEQSQEQEYMQDELEETLEEEQEIQARQGFFARLKAIVWYPIQLVQDGFSWIMSFFSETQKTVS